jgi:hypothetical protein
MRADRQLWFQQFSSTSGNDFREWYSFYEREFPLDDEREPVDGFQRLLDINVDEQLQARFGPYSEIITAIRLPPSNEIVGGSVLGVATSEQHEEAGYLASVQVIYIFVRETYVGLNNVIVTTYIKQRASQFALSKRPHATAKNIAIFFEANNPRRMSREDIENDRDLSGVDPWRRYRAWLSLGGVPLKLQYVQPALQSDKSPVKYLDLFYLFRWTDQDSFCGPKTASPSFYIPLRVEGPRRQLRS